MRSLRPLAVARQLARDAHAHRRAAARLAEAAAVRPGLAEGAAAVRRGAVRVLGERGRGPGGSALRGLRKPGQRAGDRRDAGRPRRQLPGHGQLVPRRRGDKFTALRDGTDRLGGAVDTDALEAYLAPSLTGAPIDPPALNRIDVTP